MVPACSNFLLEKNVRYVYVFHLVGFALLCNRLTASSSPEILAEVVVQDDACVSSAASHSPKACSVELLQTDSKRPGHNLKHVLARVAGVYTYGAPAASILPLKNFASLNGCFAGLRAYAENLLGDIHQVDPLAMSNPYNHSQITTLALHEEGKDSYYVSCNYHKKGETTWPIKKGQVYDHPSFRTNSQKTYEAYCKRLSNVFVDGANISAEDPISSARAFCPLAFAVYESRDSVKAVLAEHLAGWRLVASEIHNASKWDKDPVMLFQKDEDLQCALVFGGLNSGSEFSPSYLPGKLCGFKGVLEAYRHEISSITSKLWPRFGWKLGKCSRLSCVGEGVGGALCDLFAACLNSGRIFDSDYMTMSWKPSSAQLLDEV